MSEQHGVNGSELRVCGLSVEYGGARALTGVDLEVRSGQTVALLGANGAGKSTVIRSVSRVLDLYGGHLLTGSVMFRGEDLAGKTANGVVGAGVAQVPEGRKVFKELTVAENLLVALKPERRRRPASHVERVYAMFPPLARRARTAAGWLSGGEQQMLAIGRALMTDPALLMIDELSLGLAPKVVYSIVASLEQLRGETGIGILLVEQNARLALTFSDYAYVIENGRVAQHGESALLAADGEVERRYLGAGSSDETSERAS